MKSNLSIADLVAGETFRPSHQSGTGLSNKRKLAGVETGTGRLSAAPQGINLDANRGITPPERPGRWTTPSLLFMVASVAAMLTLSAHAGHPNPDKIADAIYRAEGGAKARSPYGVLSVKVKNAADARRITINSINNNWKRWEKAGKPGEFINFMADRWCPPSADPVGNRNWKKNVKAIYESK